MIALLTTARATLLRASLVLLAFVSLNSCGKPVEIDYAKLKYSSDGLFLDPATQKPFTGVALEHYPNGQLSKEFHIKNGKFHGVAREWYKSGQPSSVTEFTDGEHNGKNTEWNENGSLYMERVYDHEKIVTQKKY